ncbi:unnamed protein product [Pleuronectes platessa]|uniref:Secreted protein n=1 Tax=Pleuronectes platessa TaxID=8262 RepID=A0A9N7YNF2_PLEPL|nr:unnamed protein product [Pleuronectes platessa]
MRSVFGFLIFPSSSLAGLSGPVLGMITALIKDGLAVCESQERLVNKESGHDTNCLVRSVSGVRCHVEDTLCGSLLNHCCCPHGGLPSVHQISLMLVVRGRAHWLE